MNKYSWETNPALRNSRLTRQHSTTHYQRRMSSFIWKFIKFFQWKVYKILLSCSLSGQKSKEQQQHISHVLSAPTTFWKASHTVFLLWFSPLSLTACRYVPMAKKSHWNTETLRTHTQTHTLVLYSVSKHTTTPYVLHHTNFTLFLHITAIDQWSFTLWNDCRFTHPPTHTRIYLK